MTFIRFCVQILSITLVTLIVAFIVSQIYPFEDLLELYCWAGLAFVLFNGFIFFYAYTTSKSDKLFSFNNVVSASFLIKLIMSIGFLLIWEKLYDPQTNTHLLNYIIVYIIYTVYEVYFLTKLANPKR